MKKFILSLLISFCALFIIRSYFWGYVVYNVIKWYNSEDWFQVFLAIFLLLMLALIIKRIRHKLYAPIGIVLGMLIVFSIDALSDNCHPKKYIFDDYSRNGNCLIKENGRKAYLLDKKQNVIIESVKFERFPTFFTFIDKETLQDSYGYIHNEYDETDDGLRYRISQLYLYDESYKLYAIYEIETASDDDYIEHNKSLYGDDWDIEESDCKEIESINDIIERFLGKIKSSYNIGDNRCRVFLDINLVSTKRDNEPVNSKNVRNSVKNETHDYSGVNGYNSTGDFNNYNSTGENYDNVNQDVETTHQKKWRNVTRIVDCPQCYTGSCTTCNGKGWYDSPYGTGSIKCPNCDPYNIGKCSNCHGSGKIEKIEQVWE